MTLELKAMEIKKTEQAVGTKQAETRTFAIVDFISNIKEEFAKITWTTPDELRTYAKIVVGVTFLFGMVIYAADVAIQSCLFLLGKVFHLIFG